MSLVNSTVGKGAAGTTSADTIQVLVCTSIAFYNSIELVAMTLTTFKEWNWKSLYFDSMLVASLGIIPYNIGLLIEYFYAAPYAVAMSISSIGWVMLITGQSLVLYSRLNLVFTNDQKSRWILKFVKWMIITNAVVWHTSITVIQFGTKYGSHQKQFHKAIFYGERIQMTAFCIQEFIISGLYVWKTIELLKVISKQHIRRIILGLFLVNIVIILLDIGLLVLEYNNMYASERSWKVFVYSVKLKLEFIILAKLVDLVQSNSRNLSATLGDANDFLVADRTPSNTYRHADQQRQAPDSTKGCDSAPNWLAELEEGRKFSHVENIDKVP